MTCPPQPDPRSDQDLIAVANQGDANGFEGLYHRYKQWVLDLAFRFTVRTKNLVPEIPAIRRIFEGTTKEPSSSRSNLTLRDRSVCGKEETRIFCV